MTDTDHVTDKTLWERHILEKLALGSLKEQRNRRRWGIFFKLVYAFFILAILWIIWPTDTLPGGSKEKKHVALVDLTGEISATALANSDNVISGLQDAFDDRNTKAVILRINSPGGSAVQASTVYNEIRYLRSKHPKIKLYAVCDDLCASAAYYIASSADDIYANKASLVGSIGVLIDGFGFVDTMQKMGVQRRLITSGAHKGFLDPFSPIKPDDEKLAQNLIDGVHQQFINDVKQGRGNRLKVNENTFSGLVWSGEQALPQGLIDGFGDVDSIARDIVHNDNIVDYTYKPGLFDELSNRMGAEFSQTITSKLGLQKHDGIQAEFK